jgi:methionyl-tRNA formyltransferase
MRVLYLGPTSRLVAFIAQTDAVRQETDPLEPNPAADFLVSYGYRHVIPAEVLASFSHRAVNLHISYLPWNRGADPNLWSHIDDTPKGVTIHNIDAGIDTGPIIVQQLVDFSADDTLATSYAKLKDTIERLFIKHWPVIRAGRAEATPQIAGEGSYHRLRDRAAAEHLLNAGWDTPIAQLRADRLGMSAREQMDA